MHRKTRETIEQSKCLIAEMKRATLGRRRLRAQLEKGLDASLETLRDA